MYAIIETGGKQYRVTAGDVVSLEKLDGEAGKMVTFDKVLLIGGKPDNQVLVGTPYLAQATLEAEILQQAKGEKILTIKYKRRKGYRRMMGHRQMLTRVLVTKINDGRGQATTFDASQRAEALRRKASIPFSTRQATHQAKHVASKESVKPAATPKASGTVTKKTSTKSKKA
jgi:large subunit ribosomal protein L21